MAVYRGQLRRRYCLQLLVFVVDGDVVAPYLQLNNYCWFNSQWGGGWPYNDFGQLSCSCPRSSANKQFVNDHTAVMLCDWKVTAGLAESMAASSRGFFYYGFSHLQTDYRGPRSAP